MIPTKKIIFFTALGYLLYLIIGIVMATADWISVLTFVFLFLLMPVTVVGLIVLIRYLLKHKEKKVEKETRLAKLNSSTAEQFVKDLCKEKLCSSFEIDENISRKIGKEGKITPIFIITGFAPQAHKRYNFFINALDLEYTYIKGYLSKEEMDSYANDLCDAPIRPIFEKIEVRDESAGTTRQVTRQIPNEIAVIKDKEED